MHEARCIERLFCCEKLFKGCPEGVYGETGEYQLYIYGRMQ